jgi:hypothetical protein
MAQNNTGRGRVGVDVSATRTMIVGLWESRWDTASPTEWIGQLRPQFSAAMAVAQKYHDKLEQAKLAKLKGQPVPTLESQIMERRAREDLKALKDVFARVNAVEDAAFLQRANLKPFTYDANLVDAGLRAELRALLRTMPPTERMKAIDTKAHFQRAALETAPELSGLTEPVQQHLHERLVQEKFPELVSASEEALAAAGLCKRAIAAAEAAAKYEIVASGAQIEPTTTPEVKAWA